MCGLFVYEFSHSNTLHLPHRLHRHGNRAVAGGDRASARTDGETSGEEKDGRRKRRRQEEDEVKRVCVKKEDGGEDKEVKNEVTEQPQRLRRKTVGPPIRYLLESEEQSHGLGIKHARRSEAGGGASEDTAMIDRSEDEDRQTGWTNQDTGNKLKRGRGHLKKVVIDSETVGGASMGGASVGGASVGGASVGHVLADRQTGATRQTHQVYRDLQSRQLTLISPCCVTLQRLL